MFLENNKFFCHQSLYLKSIQKTAIKYDIWKFFFFLNIFMNVIPIWAGFTHLIRYLNLVQWPKALFRILCLIITTISKWNQSNRPKLYIFILEFDQSNLLFLGIMEIMMTTKTESQKVIWNTTMCPLVEMTRV